MVCWDVMCMVWWRAAGRVHMLTIVLLSGRWRKPPSSPRWSSRSAMPLLPSRRMETRGESRRRRKLPSWWASLLGSLCCAGSPSSSLNSSALSALVTSHPFGKVFFYGSGIPIPFLIHWSIQLSTKTTTMPSGTCFPDNTEQQAGKERKPPLLQQPL